MTGQFRTPDSLLWRWLLLIFLVGVAARVAAVLLTSNWHEPYYEYMEIAGNLIRGQGFSWSDQGKFPLQPTSYFVPIYVYWCAGFMWLGKNQYLAMYLAQAVVSASACIPAYMIASEVVFRKSRNGVLGRVCAFSRNGLSVYSACPRVSLCDDHTLVFELLFRS